MPETGSMAVGDVVTPQEGTLQHGRTCSLLAIDGRGVNISDGVLLDLRIRVDLNAVDSPVRVADARRWFVLHAGN